MNRHARPDIDPHGPILDANPVSQHPFGLITPAQSRIHTAASFAWAGDPAAAACSTIPLVQNPDFNKVHGGRVSGLRWRSCVRVARKISVGTGWMSRQGSESMSSVSVAVAVSASVRIIINQASTLIRALPDEFP